MNPVYAKTEKQKGIKVYDFPLKLQKLLTPMLEIRLLAVGSKVNLESGVEAAVLGLFAGALVGRAGAAFASSTRDLCVLRGGAGACAFAGRTGTARASGAGEDVFGGGLVALALEGGHFAARAGGLLGCVAVSLIVFLFLC